MCLHKLQSFPTYQELVSTSSESLNHFFQYLHSQAPFMKQSTLMRVLEACVGLRNKLVMEELKKMALLYKINNN